MRLRAACILFLVVCMLFFVSVVNAARRLKRNGWGAVLDDDDLWMYNVLNPKDTWGLYEDSRYGRKRY